MLLLLLDTEFSDITPAMERLSLALLSLDGRFEFYGERNDVPPARCSQFDREVVLSQMSGRPPIAGDQPDLRSRLRAFLGALPEPATLACDSFYDIQLFWRLVAKPKPTTVKGDWMNLRRYTSLPPFAQAQASYHESGHPYHHALQDVRGLRAGYLALQVHAP